MNHKDYSRKTIAHNNITHQQSSMDLEDKKNIYNFSSKIDEKDERCGCNKKIKKARYENLKERV